LIRRVVEDRAGGLKSGHVCSRCGEKYFEEKEVDPIRKMIEALGKKLCSITHHPLPNFPFMLYNKFNDFRE
jgi:hypothetical protein